LVNLPLPSHGRFLLDLNPALRGFFCVPSMIDSLEVEVLYPA
jgi:hypothetical protein